MLLVLLLLLLLMLLLVTGIFAGRTLILGHNRIGFQRAQSL